MTENLVIRTFLIASLTVALAAPVFAQCEPTRHQQMHAPKYHWPQQPHEKYPSYLPWGSCQYLWYGIPGYRSPMDCDD